VALRVARARAITKRALSRVIHARMITNTMHVYIVMRNTYDGWQGWAKPAWGVRHGRGALLGWFASRGLPQWTQGGLATRRVSEPPKWKEAGPRTIYGLAGSSSVMERMYASMSCGES
jgi:hypothetical protein